MRTINVVDMLRTTALLTSEKGIELYNEILNCLNTGQNERLRLDFKDYEYISSTFLNRSFGKLCVIKNWNFEEMKKNLIILNLSEDDMEDVELAILNANEREKLISKGIDLSQHYSSVYNY